MTEYLRLALLDHITGRAYFEPPVTLYVAFFLAGVEVSGGSYARQPASFDDAAALTATASRAGSLGGVFFSNLPTADVDEIRVMDAATGGNALFALPYGASFTSGDDKGYAPDAIGLNLSGSAA